MRLIRAELRKLFSSRILIGILLVLLIANFFLAYYLPKTSKKDAVVREVFSEYLVNRAEMDAYYEEMELWILEHLKEENWNLPYTYSGDPALTDYDILYEVKKRADYFDSYDDMLDGVIQTADRQITALHSYGYSDKTYTTKSQIYLRDAYIELLETIELDNTLSYGYDQYFNYDAVSLFILVFLTASVSYIFLHDDTVGFRAILRTTRRGRLETALAKLWASAIVSIVAVLLFLLTAFLGVGLKIGYSSPLADVQTMVDFALVPSAMTILEYLLCHTLLRLLGFLVYTFFVAAVTSVKLPYIVCYAISGLFAGGNALMFYRSYNGTAPTVKYLNLAAMTEACELLASYRTTGVFWIPIKTVTFLSVISLILVGILSVLAVWLFAKNFHLLSGIRDRMYSVFGKVIAHFRSGKRRKRALRVRMHPLWMFELKKGSAVLFLMLVSLLLILRGVYVDRTVGDMEQYDEALYYEYITEVSGLRGDARAAYLLKERRALDATLDAYEERKMAYYASEITSREYSEYMQEYYKAQAKDAAFLRVENYARYIELKNEATGYDGEMLYTSGYEALFSLSTDYYLLVAILILCYRSFSVEYGGTVSSGEFVQILRTTKKGREQTFHAKLMTYLFISALLGGAFRLVTILTVKENYVITDLSKNLYSIESFSAVTGDFSLGAYLVLDILISVFCSVITAVIVLAMSLLLKKTFAILVASLIVLVLPAVISETVLPRFTDFSILTLSAPQMLYRNSAAVSLFDTDWGYLVVCCLIHFLVGLALTAFLWERYTGEHVFRRKGVADR